MGYLSKYFSCYYATQLSRFHFVIASTFLVIVCDRTWGCFSKSVFQNYQHGDSDDDDVDVMWTAIRMIMSIYVRLKKKTMRWSEGGEENDDNDERCRQKNATVYQEELKCAI